MIVRDDKGQVMDQMRMVCLTALKLNEIEVVRNTARGSVASGMFAALVALDWDDSAAVIHRRLRT